MINPPVRLIWATFADTISLVKKYVRLRPSLNLIECAFLSEYVRDKVSAFLVAILQCFTTFVMAENVLFPQTDYSCGKSGQCDVVSISYDVMSQNSWSDKFNSISKCYWKVNHSLTMAIIAVVFTTIKVMKQVVDQYRFFIVFKHWMNVNQSGMNIYLLFWDCIVNAFLPFILVLLSFFLFSSSDEAMELVLNCVAITFIVELDDDLNDRDPVEVNDLVIQSFKKYLFLGMKRVAEDIDNRVMGRNPNFKSILEKIYSIFLATLGRKNSVLASEFLVDRLDSADYSSDMFSLNKNEKVLSTVVSYIKDGRMLPVLNGSFLIDPDPWKVKFLVLRFKNSVTINVREKHVIDFVVVENMLRKKEGKERHSNIGLLMIGKMNCTGIFSYSLF